MAAPPETPEQLNARVRSNFDAQVFMRTLGADLSVVEPGGNGSFPASLVH